MKSEAIVEAEDVAARAWERKPDSATYLLYAGLSLVLAVLTFWEEKLDFTKEVLHGKGR